MLVILVSLCMYVLMVVHICTYIMYVQLCQYDSPSKQESVYNSNDQSYRSVVDEQSEADDRDEDEGMVLSGSGSDSEDVMNVD